MVVPILLLNCPDAIDAFMACAFHNKLFIIASSELISLKITW